LTILKNDRVHIIVAGHRRCGTTYIHDVFNAVEGISVLKRKEDRRLLNIDQIKIDGLDSLITTNRSDVTIIVHPTLVLYPECLKTVVESCGRTTIIFLRRDPYERARSEFRMLCSISPNSSLVISNKDSLENLATEAIRHSQYDRLENIVERKCLNTEFVRIPYKKVLEQPQVLLEAAGLDVSLYSDSIDGVIGESKRLDSNKSNQRFLLKPGRISRYAKSTYSSLINSSTMGYKFAKALKRSEVGRFVQARLHDKKFDVDKAFVEYWKSGANV